MNQQGIFFNECSIVGQAPNEYAARILIVNLAEVLRKLIDHLKKAGQSHSLATRQTTSMRWLIVDSQRQVSFHNCLFGSYEPDQRIAAALVQQLLTKGPFTEELFNDEGHCCERQQDRYAVSLTGSSIAAAAARNGWVVSLRDCVEYQRGTLVVTFRSAQGEKDVKELPHFVEPSDLGQIKRVYEHNTKHKTNATENSGVEISSMDLEADIAQQVLDRAVDISGEKRLFARHLGHLYVFFEHTSRHYHGYRVGGPSEYQSRDAKIFNALERLGWVKR